MKVNSLTQVNLQSKTKNKLIQGLDAGIQVREDTHSETT